MTEAPETWLTPETHQRLTDELADRSGPRRTEITARIEAARAEGDLKENGGYHAAKEDQGKNEARIRQLRHLLDHAQVGFPPAEDNGRVGHGMVVTIRFSDGDVETFLLGSREEAPHSSVDVYSPTSPLGQAVIGRQVGDAVTYSLPNGKSMSVEIIDSRAYQS